LHKYSGLLKGFAMGSSLDLKLLSFYFVDISEIGKTVQLFCEHSGRTLPNGRDVICALTEMGFQSHELPEYLCRTRRISLGQSMSNS